MSTTGFIKPTKRTPEEDFLILTGSATQVARLLGMTRSAVLNRRYRLTHPTYGLASAHEVKMHLTPWVEAGNGVKVRQLRGL